MIYILRKPDSYYSRVHVGWLMGNGVTYIVRYTMDDVDEMHAIVLIENLVYHVKVEAITPKFVFNYEIHVISIYTTFIPL